MIKKKRKSSVVSTITSLIGYFGVFAVFLVMIMTGIKETGSTIDEQGVKIAEDAIRRAVVNCYALEGSYPETFEYLKENYGLEINEDK